MGSRRIVKAWHQIQPLRQKAAKATAGTETGQVFKGSFRLTLEDLVTLYADQGWKGSAYGCNAWLPIAKRAVELKALIDAGREDEARQLLNLLLGSSHNTGTVNEKRRSLDERSGHL